MNLSEVLVFTRRVFSDFDSIGAVMPTWPGAAKAMISDVSRQLGPRRILEVGPGTGPITTELARLLRPDDKLVLCEIDPFFVDYLTRRFEREPLLARVRDQVEILGQSVVEMEGEDRFDFIISAVPFTRLPAALIEDIFKTYQRLLRPGGTLTYLEYSFFRTMRRLSPLGRSERARKMERVLREYTSRYQFRFERILLNLPPANIRSLRFEDPAPEAALKVAPRWNPHRLHVAGLGMVKDAADMISILAGAGLYLRHKGNKLWPALMVGAAIAAWFHRDPERDSIPDPQALYSACDGQIMKVDTIRHPRLGDQDWVRIVTFLSVTDVHLNRAPMGGRVVDTWDQPGGFAPAYDTDASEQNASRYVVIEGPQGRCAVAQRAGFLARRVLTWCGRGELLAQGERYGMIRLGSRTDVLLPVDRVKVTVKAGDRVVAGQTVLGRWLA